MDEPTVAKSTPAGLRLAHAEHFLNQYRIQSGPPNDHIWLMAGYFDAFLFALASVWDMSTPLDKQKLDGVGPFRFFKALRNIAAHHSILAVSVTGNKFPRPFRRHLSMSVGGPPDDSSRLEFRLDVLRQILDSVELERKEQKQSIAAAKAYIATLEQRGSPVYLEDVMSEALASVRSALPHV